MEIKIRAEDMLDVLSKHGMDIVESKAIVCDLILRADPEYVKRQQLREATRVLREESKVEAEAAEVAEDVEVDEAPQYTARKSKRINFSSFGGNDVMGSIK